VALATMTMQNKLGSTLLFATLSILLIKFLIVTYQDVQLFSDVYSTNEFSLQLIWGAVITFGAFIWPFLILVGLVGFILKGKIGLFLILIFPYFVITNMVIHTTLIELYNGVDDFSQIIFSFLILIPINFPATFKIFNKQLNSIKQLKINLLALLTSIALNLGIQQILSLYLN
jgi:hypothetical protein